MNRENTRKRPHRRDIVTRPVTSRAAISCRGLSKNFGKTQAVKDLDLEVYPGQILGLIGPNGAGKTTTMRLLLDLLRPSSGEMEILETQPRVGGAQLRRHIGYLPGDLNLDPAVTARHTLAQFAATSVRPEMPNEAIKEQIDQLAKRFDLDLDRKVGTLSKGNRQKVGLVQAFMHQPQVLILDEATSGLDPLVQRTFQELLRERADEGTAILLSSHVLSEVEVIADTAAVLSHGRLVTCQPIAELQTQAAREFQARLTIAPGQAGLTIPAELAKALGPSLVAGSWQVTPAEQPDTWRVSGHLVGSMDPVVKILSRCTVHELTIAAPDLEHIVLEMYGVDPVEDPSKSPPAARGAKSHLGKRRGKHHD